MIYHENLRFLNKFYDFKKQLSLLLLYTYMVNFDSINLLPRHVAINYLKLKYDTSKVLVTGSNI